MLRTLSYKRATTLFGVFSALLGFAFYWNTLCPTVNFIDSGELATVCYKLGIAHPTGYPLFTLLGYLFSHLPLGMRVIYQMNLFAAVVCSIGLFILFRFLVFFVNEAFQKNKAQIKDAAEWSWVSFVPAFCGTIAIAFSKTFWSQALSIEVYSLHIVFLSLLLFVFTKALKSDSETGNEQSSRFWYLFAYVLGLSFTNHLSTSFLAPAFLTAYFYNSGFSKDSFKRLAILIIPFLVGLSVYLYLPIRASAQPVLNWGNPVDLEKLLWHLSGKVYRVWFLESGEAIMKQFNLFLTTLPSEFAYIGLAFALIGLLNLFKESRAGAIFTLLLFFGSAIFASFYDIHDIETYFLLAFITTGIWIAFGVKFLIQRRQEIFYKRIVALVACLAVLLIGATNYSSVDESKTTIVEDYAKDVLQSIKQDGIVLSFQWDYFVSASYYLQLVENYRTDVVIIDKELLRRSWYYPQLEQHYPWLIKASENEIREFSKELYKFERDIPYTPSVIELRYTELIHSFIEKHWHERSVYITPEIEQKYLTPYRLIPSGLALRVAAQSDTTAYAPSEIPFHLTPQPKMDKYRTGIISMYGQAYMNSGMYLQYMNRIPESNVFLGKAKELQQYLTPTE